jgi:hypothetical protein
MTDQIACVVFGAVNETGLAAAEDG